MVMAFLSSERTWLFLSLKCEEQLQNPPTPRAEAAAATRSPAIKFHGRPEVAAVLVPKRTPMNPPPSPFLFPRTRSVSAARSGRNAIAAAAVAPTCLLLPFSSLPFFNTSNLDKKVFFLLSPLSFIYCCHQVLS